MLTVSRAMLVMAMFAAIAFAEGGGEVLPPAANPHGVTLTEMAEKLADFNFSGNDPQYYPKTPFFILFQDPAKESVLLTTCDDSGPGLLFAGGNTFVAPVGTQFFVPVFAADDAPPAVGTFPLLDSEATGYFFGSSQLGAKDMQIIVDGKSTPIGPAYLAGPVHTLPLPDGATHSMQLGVFLTPMSAGTHTVTLQGQVAGAALVPAIGLHCVKQDFTYTVNVVHGKK